MDAARGLVVELPAFGSMVELIAGGESALDRARDLEQRAEAVHELASVRLLAPLMPNSLRDCLVFEGHARNASAELARMGGRQPAPIPPVWYAQPIYYKGNRCSVIGHDQDVLWPSYSKVMDYELELACVIGRRATDMPREEALQAVFGYTIFNDASARDAQTLEMPGGLGPAKGKDFDTGNVLGPWIVTADELDDPQRLTMVARVNGEEWSRGNSADMHHPFDRIIEFVSRSETLYPSDVIASGTANTGSGQELGRFLTSGDVVELEIEGIGVLRNRFVATA